MKITVGFYLFEDTHYGFLKVLSPYTVAFICLLALVSAVYVRSFPPMSGDP